MLNEQHDEWQVSDRRYLSEALMAQLTPPAPAKLEPSCDTSTDAGQQMIDNLALKTAQSP